MRISERLISRAPRRRALEVISSRDLDWMYSNNFIYNTRFRMAEDLDSFFKKKKTKGKKKYTTSDSIKKAVEDSQKVEEQKKSLPNDEDPQNIDPVLLVCYRNDLPCDIRSRIGY